MKSDTTTVDSSQTLAQVSKQLGLPVAVAIQSLIQLANIIELAERERTVQMYVDKPHRID